MATVTLGSNATNTLTALVASGNLAAADVNAIQNVIKDDQISGNPIYPGAFSHSGLLYVPNRGVLKVLPGDYVAVDAFGWPILVAGGAISYASTSWTHS